MKLPPLLAICLGVAGSLIAAGQIATPSVGYVRYPNGDVRPVYGLEGNYIVGDSVLTAAEAVSFSEAGGLISQAGKLALVDPKLATLATADLHEPAALLRVDKTLETAVAWLPGSRVLIHWNGTSLAAAPISAIADGETVTSVRKLDVNTASLLVVKPDTTVARYLISLRTAELKSSVPIPAACRPIWDDGARILCLSDRKLSLLSLTGDTVQALSLPADESPVLEEVAGRCLHLSGTAPGDDWLLHLDDKDLQLYQLPSPKSKSVSTDEANSKSAQ